MKRIVCTFAGITFRARESARGLVVPADAVPDIMAAGESGRLTVRAIWELAPEAFRRPYTDGEMTDTCAWFRREAWRVAEGWQPWVIRFHPDENAMHYLPTPAEAYRIGE